LPEPQSVFETESTTTFAAFTRRDLVQLLFKHKAVILGCFVIATIVVWAGLISLPPTYESVGKVLVNTEQQDIPSFFTGLAAARERVSVAPDPVNRRMENEMELVATRAIAAEVVRELGLGYRDVHHKPATLLLEPFVVSVKELLGRETAKTPAELEQETIDALRNSITIVPAPSRSPNTNSNVIVVAVRAPSAEQAQRILEKLFELYTRFGLRRSEEEGTNAYDIVHGRAQEAFGRLIAARERLESFLADRGIPAGLGEYAPPPAIGEAAAAVPAAAGAGRRPGDIITTPRDDTTVAALQKQLIDMETELVQLRQRFRGSPPEIVALERSIAGVKARLRREVERGAENQAAFADLSRVYKEAEAEYLQLQRRLQEIALFLEVNRGQSSSRIVIDPPILPHGSAWQKLLLVGLLGSFGGLFFGLGLAGFREYADHRFRNEAEVERYLGVTVFGSIPKSRRGEVRDAVDVRTVLAAAGRSGRE